MQLCTNIKEKKRILEIFKGAFKNSPGITWMTKGDDSKTESLLKLFIAEAIVKKGAFLTNNKNGAVLFFQLQNRKNTILLIARKLFIVVFVIGIKTGIKTIKYKKLIDNKRPKDGFLGWLVASDQSVSGTEAAYEIRNEMFRIADEAKLPIFVETTVPRVRALYRISGYTEYTSIEHPYEDLTIWFFRRNPETKN